MGKKILYLGILKFKKKKKNDSCPFKGSRY